MRKEREAHGKENKEEVLVHEALLGGERGGARNDEKKGGKEQSEVRGR